MQDKETSSLWSHILGKAMSGKLVDTQLEVVPSSLTDWKTWKELHPNTTATLLSRTSRMFTNRYYSDEHMFVVGLTQQNAAKAWNYGDLNNTPLSNDKFQDTPLVIFFDIESSTPFLFDRRHGERELTFKQIDGKIMDEETDSEWDLTRGKAISGALNGTQLKRLACIPSFAKSWLMFHPDSEYGLQENDAPVSTTR